MRGLVVFEDGSARIKEMPRPEIGEYQALVRVLSGGLCGTDLKILHNKLKFFENYPTILGHEGVGEVVEVGSKVRSFAPGDHIILPYIFQEKTGEYYSTWGAFAEYAVAGDADALYEDGYQVDNKIFFDFYHAQRKIPKELDPIGACMIVTFREVYSAIKHLGLKKDENIVVYGAGPVGLTFIKFLKLIGMYVICVDIRDDKMEQAKAMGADLVFNSTKTDIVAEMKQLYPDGIDNTLDAAGVTKLINTSLKIIKNRGKICVYGVTPNNTETIDWEASPYNFSIAFNQWPEKMEEAEVHEEIIAWMLEGKLNGMEFISDVFDFDDSEKAVELFESGKMLKKIALRF